MLTICEYVIQAIYMYLFYHECLKTCKYLKTAC